MKFKPKNCKYCNKVFTPNHPHNLYCSKQCRYFSDLEHTNERKRKYRKRWYGKYNDRNILNVGTGSLGTHRNIDFNLEVKKIKSELKRIGLT